jgi:glycerate kinase
MKKIVIASDSFKGSLSSAEVASAIERGIRKILPRCKVVSLPVADGGEGTVEAMIAATNGKQVKCNVHDPLMNIIEAQYGILGDNKTAIIEMSAASGLPLVPLEKRNPMETTTYGTGELIKDAIAKGCTHLLIGIGGSATNDAGTGMLQALGFRFRDKDGEELKQGGKILEHISNIDYSQVNKQILDSTYTIACDVTNPFSGMKGAAYVFAPQKGADATMAEKLDKGLKNFASVIQTTLHKDIENIAGAGAAGGMGGAFVAFLNAELKPGVDMVLNTLDFDKQIEDADLIITGEGKLDKQTAMGKTPMGVLNAGKKQDIPVVAIGGLVEDKEILEALGFDAVLPILSHPVPLARAMEKEFAQENIIRTIETYLISAEK